MADKNEDISNIGNKQIVNEIDLLVKDIQYKLAKNDIDKNEVQKYKFKLKHFKNALKIIKIFPNKIKKGEDLKDISGIGKGIMSRIDEILENKKLSEIDQSEIKVIKKEMDLIEELSKVINIGSKVAKQLIEKHNIKSIDELKKKVNSNKIEVNDKIKMGLKYHGVFETKIPRKEIDSYDDVLKKLIKSINKDLILTIAGSYRRGKEVSNDIDILISHLKIQNNKDYSKIDINYLNEFVCLLKKSKIIVDDLTDTDNGTKYMGFSKLPRKKVRRIDVRFVPYEYYPAALLYFTGSYELNTQMRQVAKTMGYKLNEYGLFKEKKDGTFSDNPIKVKSEKDIFKKLKLDYLEPPERG
jgi:DNA polymerase/3'-5' exonuclease PolX